MKAYRIGADAHPVFDGRGAALYPGRWNRAGQRVSYCGATFAICLLERLCYTALGRIPAGDKYIAVDIPDRLVERLDPQRLEGWDATESVAARDFGARWCAERRSVALLVPSAVTKLDWNVAINQDHADFGELAASDETLVEWDRRLFTR